MTSPLDDLDEHAFQKKPKPIGWFVAGITAISSLAFVFAYYLPLRTAHLEIAAAHETLAKKSRELDHALKEARTELSGLGAKHGVLAREAADRQDRQKERSAQLDIALATAGRALDKFAKSGVISKVTHHGVHITSPEKILFRPNASATLPAAGPVVCGAAGAVPARPGAALVVTTEVTEGDPKAWTLGAERAVALGALATGRCKLSSDRLILETKKAGDDKNPKVHLTLRTMALAEAADTGDAPGAPSAE